LRSLMKNAWSAATNGLTGKQTNWAVLLLYAAYPIAVFTGKAKMPVRVLKYDEQTVVVGISSDDFAREFRVLNV